MVNFFFFWIIKYQVGISKVGCEHGVSCTLYNIVIKYYNLYIFTYLKSSSTRM